jgi:hypothetical protein
VAGVRGAHEERLYLEQYLDRPVEQAVGDARQAAGGIGHVARREIAEVGQLGGADGRTAACMVARIPAYLIAQRYRWIVFTATTALRQMLSGFGAPLVELARADGARVARSGDHWGRYYDTDPRVYVGRLSDAGHLPGFAAGDGP